MLEPADITAGLSQARISSALKHCARHASHRRQWIDEAADRTDILPDTFESYFYGKTCPGLDAFQKMVAHLGPAFASHVLCPAGVVCIAATDHAIIKDARLVKGIRNLIPQLKGIIADAEPLDDRGEAA